MRWASKLERPEIERLLRQAGALRDEVMRLSHQERFVKAAAAEPARVDLSRGQRRQALIERSFVFEDAFGDNPKLPEALETAEKAAPTGLPVLIDGESGSGKELMAKVMMLATARQVFSTYTPGGALVEFDSAAYPVPLLGGPEQNF